MQSLFCNFYSILQSAFCKFKVDGKKTKNRYQELPMPLSLQTTLNTLMEIKSHCGCLGFCIDGCGVLGWLFYLAIKILSITLQC